MKSKSSVHESLQKVQPPPPSSNLSNALKRTTFGLLMISGFILIILSGPLLIMLLVLAIQMACFSEVINIGYNSNKVPSSIPFFRSICWYFVIAANYFVFIEILAPHFQDLYKPYHYLRLLVQYHRFVSFCIYFVGIVLFMFSLVKKHDLKQFKILAWTHLLLVVIVLQSHLVIANMLQGLIWTILPCSLVILNDIFAYVCGRIWGKTPLIELSPKKTWEGFIGGAILTLIAGLALSNIMCKFQYFVCPISGLENEDGISMNWNCTRSYLFEPVRFWGIDHYNFARHFFWFALFASIIAPFGGFCASGFKRAFKVKDFGDVIPGHGGIMDRFDCQYLMTTFVNVYVYTFVRDYKMDLIFEKILYMDDNSQLELYNLLKQSLQTSQLIPNSTLF